MSFNKLFAKLDSLMNDFFTENTTVNEKYSKKISNAEHDVEMNWSNVCDDAGNVILFSDEQLANITSDTDGESTYNTLIFNDGKFAYICETGEIVDRKSINWVINYKVDVKK